VIGPWPRSGKIAANVSNFVAMTWIGTGKIAANVSPPFLSTPLARAFAVRATGLPADRVLWSSVRSRS